jgi:hypothetical protein
MMGEPEVNGAAPQTGEGGDARDDLEKKKGGGGCLIEEHVLDDAVDKLVKKTVDKYLEELTDEEDKITRTQLAAIVRYTDSFGGKGLSELIKKHRDKNERNEQARQAKKGGKKPKNKQFWDVLRKFVDGELQDLAEKYNHENEVYVLFTSRLAIELRYRARCSNKSNDGKNNKDVKRGGRKKYR